MLPLGSAPLEGVLPVSTPSPARQMVPAAAGFPAAPGFPAEGGLPAAAAFPASAASLDRPSRDAGCSSALRRLLTAMLLLALGLTLLLWSPPAWGASDPVVLQRGARLFANHCSGCHVNGGNVIRRSKTLRRQDLLKAGIQGPADVSRIAAVGVGQMDGYGEVLGEGGPEAVGAWVWRQAELGWPRR